METLKEGEAGEYCVSESCFRKFSNNLGMRD